MTASIRDVGLLVVVTFSVCLLLSGEGGGAESDLDHQELLSPRFRQRVSSSLQHPAGEPLQVGYVTSAVRVHPVTSVTLCCAAGVQSQAFRVLRPYSEAAWREGLVCVSS